VALGLVPSRSSLTAFSSLCVAWPTGCADFAEGLDGLCVCVSPAVLLAVWHVPPSKSACDLAHLRYSARLQAASQRPDARDCLHFRAAAHAALSPEHIRPKGIRRASLLTATVAPVCPISASFPLLSCALAGIGRLGVRPRPLPRCRQRLCPPSSAWLRPCRASYSCYNPLRCSLSMCSPL
jgi:hypothetical protein